MPEAEKLQPASLDARIQGSSEGDRGPVSEEEGNRFRDRHPLAVCLPLAVESLSVDFLLPCVASFRLGWRPVESKILGWTLGMGRA